MRRSLGSSRNDRLLAWRSQKGVCVGGYSLGKPNTGFPAYWRKRIQRNEVSLRGLQELTSWGQTDLTSAFYEKPSLRAVAKIVRVPASQHSSNFCNQFIFEQRPNGIIRYPWSCDSPTCAFSQKQNNRWQEKDHGLLLMIAAFLNSSGIVKRSLEEASRGP